MMFLLRLLLLALVVLQAPPAAADTDQRCLAACVNDGKSASSCLPQCTYNVKPDKGASATSPPPVDNPYRVLDAPRPQDGPLQQAAPAAKAAKPPVIDRSCDQACLGKGFQYDYCLDHCTRRACAKNSVLCPPGSGSPGTTGAHD